MNFQLTAQGLTVLFALLGNIVLVSFLAGKVINQLGNISLALLRIDKELEKRDNTIAKLWERLDEVRDMINQK